MRRDFRHNFYGREFIITPNVLLPRPETEMMVDAVLNLCGKAILPGVRAPEARLPQDCKILDVGTGSGCIAINLALELPKAQVDAVDISEKALNVARRNGKRLGASKVKFFVSDLLGNATFQPELRVKLMREFEKRNIPVRIPDRSKIDVVVANLPYVDANWDWIDKEALSDDPEIALYAGDGGLKLIKKLILQAHELKVPFLVLEADPCQHARVVEYADKNGYSLLEKRGFVLVFEYA